MKTITRICPNIHYSPFGAPMGVSRSLREAMLKVGTQVATTPLGEDVTGLSIQAASQWFTKHYTDDMRDGIADVWETAPLGRWNDGSGRWRWPTPQELDGPILAGWRDFLNQDWNNRIVSARSSWGCPPYVFFRSFRQDMQQMGTGMLQFDDVSSKAPKLTRWLQKLDKHHVMLETALTDSPSRPRLATRFEWFPGCEYVVQRVRADIVNNWYWSAESPLDNPRQGAKLSLYLSARDCATMTVATLEAVLPLFVDVSLQGVIPTAHMGAVLRWRGRKIADIDSGDLDNDKDIGISGSAN